MMEEKLILDALETIMTIIAVGCSGILICLGFIFNVLYDIRKAIQDIGEKMEKK
jgi:hypothetical protein